MALKLIWIIVIVIIAIAAFWFFLGKTFFPKNVQDIMPKNFNTIKQGNFIELDSIHKGEGQAKFVKSDDEYSLLLENFKVTSGPDLYVYLSKENNIDSKDKLGEFKSLGQLKGNSGNQVYEVTEQDAKDYNSVVIWCRRFNVLFSSASLS